MIVKAEEVFKLKMAALLHDPPHKPFLLLKGLGHEDEAASLAEKIVGVDLNLLLKDMRVRLADRIASSFDRWLLSLFMGGDYIPGAFRADVVKLKNTLAPWLGVNLTGRSDDVLGNKGVNIYGDHLASILRWIEDWKWKYHVFYVLCEAEWIGRGFPVGPADTRVPTHTVFDHNYATAAVINWLLEDPSALKGHMVGVDVAGVQEFIGSSRKLRDMWASSYIVSALTWYAMLELVEALGPDIVLTPSLRLNPFYIYWLSYKVKGADKSVRDSLAKAERLAYLDIEEVIKINESMGMPPYPIIPGRTTLILPPWNIVKEFVGKAAGESVEEYLKHRFTRGWKVLWRAAAKLAEVRVTQRRGALWSMINEVFNYYYKEFSGAGFHEAPPLTLRVSSVEVKKHASEAGALWGVYDEAYRSLTSAMALSKYFGEFPASRLNLKDITLKAFSSGKGLGLPERSSRGFDYCTSCGSIPAILMLPRDESEFESAIGKLAGGTVSGYELESIKAVFKPGEKLCPWCFVKRVVSVEPRLLKALLLGYAEDDVEDVSKLQEIVGDEPPLFGFPSVSRLASVRLYEKMLDVAENVVRRVEVGKHMSLEPKALRKVRLVEEGRERAPIWWRLFAYKLEEKLRSVAKELSKGLGEDAALMLDIIYLLDPEYMWFHEDYRRYWESLFREVDKEVKVEGLRLTEWLWRYYALVKADGDSIGKLLESDLSALVEGLEGETIRKLTIERLIEKYVVESAEGPYRRVIEKSFTIARDVAGKAVEVEALKVRGDFKSLASEVAGGVGINVAEAGDRLARVVEALASITRSGRIPVTPSQHVAISSALMRAAIADVALASKFGGFVVYAGGDDLLAFVPIDAALGFVRSSRLSFAGSEFRVEGGEMSGGFLKLKGAYMPMLPTVGRSYAVYIAHYHYPLSIVISRATELLEGAKESIRLNYLKGDLERASSRKDILVIAYSPRGPESVAWLPLSWRRPMDFDVQAFKDEVTLTVELAKELVCSLDRRACDERGGGVLSRSFLYDFMKSENLDMLEELSKILEEKRGEALPIMVSLVKMLIERNVERGLGRKVAEDIYSKVFKPIISLEPGGHIIGAGRFERADGGLVVSNIVKAALLILSGMR